MTVKRMKELLREFLEFMDNDSCVLDEFPNELSLIEDEYDEIYSFEKGGE